MGNIGINNADYCFDEQKMLICSTIASNPKALDSENATENLINIKINERITSEFMGEQFDNELLIKNYLKNREDWENELSKEEKIQIETKLEKYFSFDIINWSSKSYSLISIGDFPIIQEAKDPNGNWKPIEYNNLVSTFLYDRKEECFKNAA